MSSRSSEEPEAPQERQEDERQHDDDCEPNDVRADSDSDGDEEELEMEDEDGAVHRPQTRSRTTAYEQLPSEKNSSKKFCGRNFNGKATSPSAPYAPCRT